MSRSVPASVAWLAPSILVLAAAAPSEPGPPAREESAPAAGAVLRVSSAGLLLEEPGRERRLFAAASDLVDAVGALEGTFVVERDVSGDDGAILPGKAPRRTTRIAAGEIPVLELLRFLADSRGLPVLHEGEDAAFAGSVTVPAEIPAADASMAKALLEAGGFSLRDRALPSGERVVVVWGPGGAKTAATGEPDVPYPLVVVEDSGGRRRTVRSGTTPRGDRRIARGPGPDAISWEGLVLEPVPDVVVAHVPLSPGEGILVRQVEEDAATRFPEVGGLRRNDILTHVNEIAVRHVEDLPATLGLLDPGSAIRYRVLRKGFTKIITTRKD